MRGTKKEVAVFRGFPISFNMTGYLNIDINLIKGYSGSKRRKELLALAIGCHLLRSNAVIFNFNRFYIRKHFSVGKVKAERLLQDAMDDQLFTFTGENVSVGSFRDKSVKRDRRGNEYRSAFVHRFTYDTEKKYTLKELYNLVNDVLTIFPISAQEEDCLQHRGGLYNRFVPTLCDANSRTLTLRKFSQNNKMSVSSTSRILKRLVANGVLSKEPSRQYAVIGSEHIAEIQDCLNHIGRKSFTFRHGSLTYIIVPCLYSIAKRDVGDSFHHKIYNFHRSNGRNQYLPEPYSTIPQFNE